MITFDARPKYTESLKALVLRFDNDTWKLRWYLEEIQGNLPILRIYRFGSDHPKNYVVPSKALNALKSFFYRDLHDKKKREIKISWSKIHIVPGKLMISGERGEFKITIMFHTYRLTFHIFIEDTMTGWSIEKAFNKKNCSGIDAGRWLGKVFFKWRTEKSYCPQ